MARVGEGAALSSTSSVTGPDGPGGTGEPDVPHLAVRAALARRPTRFLISLWPLRCWAHLLGGALFGVGVLASLVVLISLGVVLAVVGVGLLLLACTGRCSGYR
jgi:hypothetical protein